MEHTSQSLLERLRQPNAAEAWQRFVQLYTPLIFYWARRTGMQQQDAADLVQEVFALLVEKLPQFHYDRDQTFRGWLRTVTLNKWRENHRRGTLPMAGDNEALGQVVRPDETDAFSEQEYQRLLARRALELMQSEFQETTWKACWEVVVNERAPEEVAADLGITLGAVYAAKSRVLRRLRRELDGMLD